MWSEILFHVHGKSSGKNLEAVHLKKKKEKKNNKKKIR